MYFHFWKKKISLKAICELIHCSVSKFIFHDLPFPHYLLN